LTGTPCARAAEGFAAAIPIVAVAPLAFVALRDGGGIEQRRIVTVGACLSCHAGDSPVTKRALAGFAGGLRRRSARRVLPAWR